jgi:hypothetical protein
MNKERRNNMKKNGLQILLVAILSVLGVALIAFNGFLLLTNSSNFHTTIKAENTSDDSDNDLYSWDEYTIDYDEELCSTQLTNVIEGSATTEDTTEDENTTETSATEATADDTAASSEEDTNTDTDSSKDESADADTSNEDKKTEDKSSKEKSSKKKSNKKSSKKKSSKKSSKKKTAKKK